MSEFLLTERVIRVLDKKPHYIENLALRSDIENNNIYGCVLVPQGYVGNRPADFDGEFHEDDTWAIDVRTPDGLVVEIYLYTSQFEYDRDVSLIKNIAV